MHPLLESVRHTIAQHRLLRPNDRVVVAVSGGPDSVALLSVLVALRLSYRLTLRVAYVDHGLRPKAVREEMSWVRRLGKMWGVPVHILKGKVQRQAGQSLEAVAREVRYRALLRLAKQTRCGVIALGHTEDDQAETVLMWILRGTGSLGLAGMAPCRVWQGVRIVRPLLECSRNEVEQYIKALGLVALQDLSNRSEVFLRNRVRRKLIPLLEREYNPRIREHLAQLARWVREDREWMEAEFARWFKRVGYIRLGTVVLWKERVVGLPRSLRKGILRVAIQRLQGHSNGLRVKHWEILDQLLCKEGKAADLPLGLRAESTSDRLKIHRPKSRNSGKLVLE